MQSSVGSDRFSLDGAVGGTHSSVGPFYVQSKVGIANRAANPARLPSTLKPVFLGQMPAGGEVQQPVGVSITGLPPFSRGSIPIHRMGVPTLVDGNYYSREAYASGINDYRTAPLMSSRERSVRTPIGNEAGQIPIRSQRGN